MSQEFYPNGDKSHLNFIPSDRYESVLEENPELRVHPEFLTSSTQNSRDFKISEGGARQSLRDIKQLPGETVEEQLGRLDTEVDNGGDGAYGNSYRTGSVYYDANEGIDVREHLEKMGLLPEEAYDNVPQTTQGDVYEKTTPEGTKVSTLESRSNSPLKIYNEPSPSSL